MTVVMTLIFSSIVMLMLSGDGTGSKLLRNSLSIISNKSNKMSLREFMRQFMLSFLDVILMANPSSMFV